MKILFLLFLSVASLLCAKNDLQYETSPYLKQHENNPVHWYAWNKKTLLLAQKEDKPLFLSIGYSTCHWCHVMARESFENEKIAQLLNKYFISVKVDREEMPQIDALYQNIFYHVHKRTGGWPLSVFMTPQREVFYITGYIPPQKESYSEGFSELIEKLSKVFTDKKVLKQEIDTIQNAVAGRVKLSEREEKNISLYTLKKSLKKSFDTLYTGFGTGRKFPEASKLALMMDLAAISQDNTLQKYSFEMLDIMALRGLYDHIGGGFFRYSVNANWEIPHFEKMLYNQAELVSLYVRAYTASGKKLYKSVVQETTAMVKKRFLHHNLYWSASSAESQGKEGAFFTFTPDEIKSALKNNAHADAIEDALGFSIEGNFNNSVHINFDTDTRPPGFASFKAKLLHVREKKKYPFIDTKINTAWNAMMIEALYKASRIDKKYAKLAEKNLTALRNLMFLRGELYHQTLLGVQPKQKGLLEDYSFLISALIAGYEVDYDEKKLDFAEYLLTVAKYKFYKNGLWYLSADALHVKAGLNDKYYTSPLSKMLQNIIKLASLKASFRYEKLFQSSMEKLKEALIREQSNAPALAQAYLMQKLGIVVVKSSKDNLLKNAKILQTTGYPYVLSEVKPYKDFLACTLRRCFIKDHNITNVLHVIDKEYIRR
ncbi:DUF255 domain-containing protein [Sulfurimonas sp. SWIR-19]|uniref:thioredoxin domain-containing protein n=1 Tax=Sulfurimonas sp. SWIR-19 TaxID=2878390 RepID=UPI001CF45D60|nr:DUF255 domain-containing protein [Sulfurimonas sp. SWIR-19]UCN01336.1 DUF255 domain-containing protein [Sulfurimonas sp. SWIR-19]